MPGDYTCGAQGPEGVFCTRPIGHAPGVHSAVGFGTWTDCGARSSGSVAVDQAQPTLAGKLATIRELYDLGAIRVKVGDIEAEFPPRVPELGEQRERTVERSQQELERDFKRDATGESDAEGEGG